MNFQSVITHTSVVYPEISYRIRRLSVLERVQRDAQIFEHQIEAELLSGEYDQLPKDEKGNPINKAEAFKLDARIAQIMNRFIKPAVIEAGLIEVIGAQLDGEPMTVEQFRRFADEPLIEEVYTVCEAASRMSHEQLKNWQSPGTLRDQAAGVSLATTAGDASATLNIVNGIVVDISQAK